MYKIAFCSLNNTNLKRLVFYKKIHDYFADNSSDSISKEELIDHGLNSDLSVKRTLDEIIGMLYAPFLIADSYETKNYRLSYNGRLRFEEYFSETNFLESEFPLTINYGENIVFKRWITSLLPEEEIIKFIDSGWTRNKSKKRLMIKVKSKSKHIETIEDILKNLNAGLETSGDFIKLTKRYGTRYKTRNNISCDLHSRFLAKSNVIERNPKLFYVLLDELKMPVDWGGKPIMVNDFRNLVLDHNISSKPNELLYDSIQDGLFRFANENSITFTSTGYRIIHTFTNQYRTVNMFLRKIDKQNINIEIGENTNTYPWFKDYFAKRNFNYKNGWFSKQCAIEELLNLLSDLYETICNHPQTM